MITPHVDNLYTLIAVVSVGILHVVQAALAKRRSITIKHLVNGRLSEKDLRVEQLTSELSKHGIPIPPPAHPVVRTIIVREDTAKDAL